MISAFSGMLALFRIHVLPNPPVVKLFFPPVVTRILRWTPRHDRTASGLLHEGAEKVYGNNCIRVVQSARKFSDEQDCSQMAFFRLTQINGK